VVKVIWQKAALSPHMDGSNVFATRRQCAPWGSPKSTSKTESRLIQPFMHISRQSVPVVYNGPPLSALKIAPSYYGVISTPSNTCFLGPTQVHKNGISISLWWGEWWINKGEVKGQGYSWLGSIYHAPLPAPRAFTVSRHIYTPRYNEFPKVSPGRLMLRDSPADRSPTYTRATVVKVD